MERAGRTLRRPPRARAKETTVPTLHCTPAAALTLTCLERGRQADAVRLRRCAGPRPSRRRPAPPRPAHAHPVHPPSAAAAFRQRRNARVGDAR
ncbi:hypothetical protein KPATCC21470_8700 [Kitasatospora purpeofusca]